MKTFAIDAVITVKADSLDEALGIAAFSTGNMVDIDAEDIELGDGGVERVEFIDGVEVPE